MFLGCVGLLVLVIEGVGWFGGGVGTADPEASVQNSIDVSESTENIGGEEGDRLSVNSIDLVDFSIVAILALEYCCLLLFLFVI